MSGPGLATVGHIDWDSQVKAASRESHWWYLAEETERGAAAVANRRGRVVLCEGRSGVKGTEGQSVGGVKDP